MRIDSTQQSAVGASQTDSRAREVIDTAHKCFEYIIVCMFTDVCHATEMTSDAVRKRSASSNGNSPQGVVKIISNCVFEGVVSATRLRTGTRLTKLLEISTKNTESPRRMVRLTVEWFLSPRRENNRWLGWKRVLKRNALSMEDKMAAGTLRIMGETRSFACR